MQDKDHATNFSSYSVEASTPLRDQIADAIRKMILNGTLRANEQVSQRTLANQLNVSTTPVKDALRLLEAEGLVYTKPRVGSFISEISRSHIRELVYMRAALEGIAAFFSTQYMTDVEIQDLRSLLLQNEQLISERGDILHICRNNRKFHDIIRDGSRNDYLINLVTTIQLIDHAVRDLAQQTPTYEELNRTFAEHMQLLRAIEQRNSALVEQLMNDHFRRVGDSIVSYYEIISKT
jgi:DNA-binding GntR family transcriptional regulator